METKKERKNRLIALANEVIQNNRDIYQNGSIRKWYNGKMAAFSVSVALSGLKPTLAIYYSGNTNAQENAALIVQLLRDMYNRDNGQNISTKQFFEMVCRASEAETERYRKQIIEYAIALKLTIRTFNLV